MKNTLELHVAINRNRVKEYSNSVYLKPNSNFEIELFNGMQQSYGAQLYINGLKLSDKLLVLRPGERVFLDRFIDEQIKFKFDTYNVDVSDTKVREAIKKNGKIHVKFFREIVQWDSNFMNVKPIQNKVVKPDWGVPLLYDNISTGNTTLTNSTTTLNTTGTLNNGSVATPSVNYTHTYFEPLSTSGDLTISYSTSIPVTTFASTTSPTIETGRIEKGKKSKQKLTDSNSSFESNPSFQASIQILPESNRPNSYSSSEIRNYCSECGRKSKRGYKFCPGCGTEI